MPTIHYWPQKNKPQPLSHLHRLSLDGVTLQQGENEVTDADYARVLGHSDTPMMVECGALEVRGWAREDGSHRQAEDNAPVEAPSLLLLPPIEKRLAELQELASAGNWRSLKTVAEGHGITRPSDGWDAAVLPILVAEYGQTAAEEAFTEPGV